MVDDEPGIRQYVGTILARSGFETIEAADGCAALELLGERADSVQVLLTDVVMKPMDGVDLAEAVRRDYPHIGIVFMSGFASRMPVGFTGVQAIDKPFAASALLEKVQAACSTG